MQRMTFEQFKTIPADSVIQTVVTKYVYPQEPENVEFMFVVKKGRGYDDWAIYWKPMPTTEQQVLHYGNKLHSETRIQRIFPCDQEAFERCRP